MILNKVDNANNGSLSFHQQGQMGLSFQGPKGEKVSDLCFGELSRPNHRSKQDKVSASGTLNDRSHPALNVLAYVSVFLEIAARMR